MLTSLANNCYLPTSLENFVFKIIISVTESVYYISYSSLVEAEKLNASFNSSKCNDDM